MSPRVFLPGALLALLVGGCASVRLASRGVEVPDSERLYVAVFVDESAAGEVGVPLADAIRLELFRRDPRQLAMVFDDETVALDGTVHAVEERRGEDGRYALSIRASALLVSKGGSVVADLGRVEARATYPLSRDRGATEEARARAMGDAMRSLARELLRRVDRAGRAQQERGEA